MVDWKKDMKLSDLLARGKGDGANGDEAKPFRQEPFAPEEAEELPFHQGEADHESAVPDEPAEESTDPEQTDTPFWKREIGFGRRRAETASEAEFETSDDEPEKRPIFTRNLSFGRANDEATSDTDLESSAVEPEETTPFWKRELAFGRRKDDAASETPVEHDIEHAEPEPAEEDLFEGDDVEKTPFWKRELGFGRHKDDAASETPVEHDLEHAEREPAEEDVFEGDVVEKTPFWKRELGFGRRRDDETPETFRQDEPEQTAEDLFEADRAERTPFWKRELAFGRRKDDAASEPPVEHEEALQPVAEDEFETDQPGKTPFWKRELGFGRRKDDAASETPVEHEEEPEPAAADEFETDQPGKTPFWKRELAFGRRKDDATPERFEQDEFDQSETEAAPEDVFEADVVEKTPFWKRELRFGRGREADDLEADDDALVAETEQVTPFWKRELGLGRRKDDAIAETPVEHEQSASEEPEPLAAAIPEPEPADELHWTDELGQDHEGDATAETPVEHQEPAFVEPEPVAAAVPEPEPVEEMTWKDEVIEGHDPEDTTPETPAEHEEPAYVEPEPVAASFAEPEPVEETPFTEEATFASASAHEGAEAVDELNEAPFWKREIKFGRRRRDADLAPPVLALPPSNEADTFMEAGPDSETGGRRFWKRELKFGRTSEEPFSQTDFDAPGEREKKPFFKLSFRRTKDPDFDAPKPEKRPFFKRELSFRREKNTGRQPSAGRAARGSRTKQLVGLKVGASQIAAARIENNGSPEVVQLARQSIEQGIVVGGELRDPDALAEALREFFTKHRLPTRNVRLGIGNNRIGVRSFEISGVHDPKQLENAIRFRAQEALPIPLDEAVLDYQVIDESASPTGIRTYRVLLVVAYRELIDRYVAACRGAGLRLVGIDLEAFALLRALSPPPAEGLPEDTALVAVSIGHDRSTFAVSNGTVCEFTRVLDWGGSSLNTSIARALDITPSQAEPVKRTLSLSERGEREEGAPAQANEHTIMAEEAVRLELQSFARELVSSLHFYQNQPGSLAIGSIALTGGTAHLPGLAAELQRLIGVKVRVGDPLRRVKTPKRVETPAQVGSMAVAIGLGIED